MSQEVLVVGMSGTGKSTSISGLDPKETFYINVAKKSLPFKGWKDLYRAISKDNPNGNYFTGDSTKDILATLEYINDKLPNIKTIIVDDFQYVMSNEYMRRAKETGYGKFTDIAQNLWSIINKSKSLRDDLIVVFMMHSENDYDANGNKITKGSFEKTGIVHLAKDAK